MFSIDLRSGEITQLTDYQGRPKTGFLHSCLNTTANEVHYWHNRKLWALSLDTLAERVLWELPEKFNGEILNATSDGKYVMLTTLEDLSHRLKLDQLHGYIGMDDNFAAKPLCQVVRVPVDGGGKAEVLHSGNVWMGHMNTSSKHPTHLTFCHEGPWDKLDNRIWAMDTASGKVWPLRERQGPGESVGHESWLADGERVGYHTYYKEKQYIGSVKFDGSDKREYAFNTPAVHVHSNDDSVIVGDGNPGGNGMTDAKGAVLIWEKNANGYDRARALCVHRCSMHMQQSHVHPRLSPDGTYVLFTSDKTGYASPYIVRLPKDLTTLPYAEAEI